MAGFVPRPTFAFPSNLPKSYFLGHHRSGLAKMTSLLSTIDLIIECRDYRVPLTSTNRLFERLLLGRPRIIVFTKRDLGVAPERTACSSPIGSAHLESRLTQHLTTPSTAVLFTSPSSPATISSLLKHLRAHARTRPSLTSSRVLVVGMPNVGKSTLLNSLRSHGVHSNTKAARTGAQPGITRAVATGVKIIPAEGDGTRGAGSGVYLLDTPGVFVPHMPDAEAMLKLSLVGCVKDGIVPLETLAEYLLWTVNKIDPGLYAHWSEPTNEVVTLLEGVAKRTGRLRKGGDMDLDGAAAWWVQRWRTGGVGRFVLDDVDDEALRLVKAIAEEDQVLSMNQARKRERKARKKQVEAE